MDRSEAVRHEWNKNEDRGANLQDDAYLIRDDRACIRYYAKRGCPKDNIADEYDIDSKRVSNILRNTLKDRVDLDEYFIDTPVLALLNDEESSEHRRRKNDIKYRLGQRQLTHHEAFFMERTLILELAKRLGIIKGSGNTPPRTCESDDVESNSSQSRDYRALQKSNIARVDIPRFDICEFLKKLGRSKLDLAADSKLNRCDRADCRYYASKGYAPERIANIFSCTKEIVLYVLENKKGRDNVNVDKAYIRRPILDVLSNGAKAKYEKKHRDHYGEDETIWFESCQYKQGLLTELGKRSCFFGPAENVSRDFDYSNDAESILFEESDSASESSQSSRQASETVSVSRSSAPSVHKPQSDPSLSKSKTAGVSSPSPLSSSTASASSVSSPRKQTLSGCPNSVSSAPSSQSKVDDRETEAVQNVEKPAEQQTARSLSNDKSSAIVSSQNYNRACGPRSVEATKEIPDGPSGVNHTTDEVTPQHRKLSSAAAEASSPKSKPTRTDNVSTVVPSIHEVKSPPETVESCTSTGATLTKKPDLSPTHSQGRLNKRPSQVVGVNHQAEQGANSISAPREVLLIVIDSDDEAEEAGRTKDIRSSPNAVKCTGTDVSNRRKRPLEMDEQEETANNTAPAQSSYVKNDSADASDETPTAVSKGPASRPVHESSTGEQDKTDESPRKIARMDDQHCVSSKAAQKQSYSTATRTPLKCTNSHLPQASNTAGPPHCREDDKRIIFSSGSPKELSQIEEQNSHSHSPSTQNQNHSAKKDSSEQEGTTRRKEGNRNTTLSSASPRKGAPKADQNATPSSSSVQNQSPSRETNAEGTSRANNSSTSRREGPPSDPPSKENTPTPPSPAAPSVQMEEDELYMFTFLSSLGRDLSGHTEEFLALDITSAQDLAVLADLSRGENERWLRERTSLTPFALHIFLCAIYSPNEG